MQDDSPRQRTARPLHHNPAGGFRNPWPDSEIQGPGGVLRWIIDRKFGKNRRPPDSSRFSLAEPHFGKPRGSAGTLSATWIGHSTVLLQLGTTTVLTDPVWSRRASPIPLLGPRRRVSPGVRFKDLPAIDAVVISHNHYDHLDSRTVRRLARRYPQARWVAPLGLRGWLQAHGVQHAWELDWWDELRVNGVAVMSLPARHFSARGLRDRMATLWCGWSIEAEGWRVFFCGDSGDHPQWGEIGRRAGPFDLMMIPIGAYDPRWFMQAVHMNPEEAVSAYEQIRGAGVERGGPPTGKVSDARHDPVMLPIHWGTFKLTDEPLDQPPERARAAWSAAGLEPGNLWLMKHGETRELTRE